jgi:hypothetical protein
MVNADHVGVAYNARGRPVACRAVCNFAETAVYAASISTASMCDTPHARHSKTYWILRSSNRAARTNRIIRAQLGQRGGLGV